MKWPMSTKRANPYGRDQIRSLQIGASLNKGRRNGQTIHGFFLRSVWQKAALALLLLVPTARLIWGTSSSPPEDRVQSPIPPEISRDSKQQSASSTSSKMDRHGQLGPPIASFLAIESTDMAHSIITATHDSPANAFKPIATIAHAISFLNCGATLTAKYKDAMLVLRHSIHQNSFWSRNSTSKYAYKMYAFVNSDPTKKCARYTEWIQRMGYTPLLLPNPVNISAIGNKYFRETIDRTGVAGSSELIKLYLYTLTDHPIVVHWDIDVVVLKPMDDLFDAILFDKDSPDGMRARSRLKIQQPLHQRLPDQIDAFFTRDIALARPWDSRQVAQGGFLVARPDMETFQRYIDVVTEANYSARCDDLGGWGRMGYGCKQGSMHFQGVVAYFYDQIPPGKGHAVELDACAWNQVAHSVIYYGKKQEWDGTCRQWPIYGGNVSMNRPEFGACHDCRIWPVEETYTAHFTACSKPWQCRHTEHDTSAAMTAITNATTCGNLIREFYRIRMDLEEQLGEVLGERISARLLDAKQAFHPELFLGYCKRVDGSDAKYIGMDNLLDEIEMKILYGF